MCRGCFPWADFRTTKGAAKLHVGLIHSGYLPEFVTVTEGKAHDVTVRHTLKFPKGSNLAVDKRYNNYTWHNQLTDK
jgi:putative transposase